MMNTSSLHHHHHHNQSSIAATTKALAGPLRKEAKDFVEKLRYCGYRAPQNSTIGANHTNNNNNSDTLSSEEFDWVFTYAETRPLIRFLTSRLSRDMVLSEDQVREYRQLEKQGKVLYGAELEEAYRAKLESDRYNAMNGGTVDGDQEASNEELQYVQLYLLTRYFL